MGTLFSLFLLIISTPEAHEERRKKEVVQLGCESFDTLHGLEGGEKVKRGRLLEASGIEEFRLEKGRAEAL